MALSTLPEAPCQQSCAAADYWRFEVAGIAVHSQPGIGFCTPPRFTPFRPQNDWPLEQAASVMS